MLNVRWPTRKITEMTQVLGKAYQDEPLHFTFVNLTPHSLQAFGVHSQKNGIPWRSEGRSSHLEQPQFRWYIGSISHDCRKISVYHPLQQHEGVRMFILFGVAIYLTTCSYRRMRKNSQHGLAEEMPQGGAARKPNEWMPIYNAFHTV